MNFEVERGCSCPDVRCCSTGGRDFEWPLLYPGGAVVGVLSGGCRAWAGLLRHGRECCLQRRARKVES